MNNFWYPLLALLPILLIFLLLVVRQWPARRAMPTAFAVTWLIAVIWWKSPVAWWAGSIVQGLVITLEVIYIIFGAILLLRILEQSGAIDRIKQGFLVLTPDPRLQAIIIGWAFGGFIEGASGFGTPAAVVGPLLLTLGFPASAAITTGLIIQSTPVSFGAVGTPLLIGVTTGLTNPSVQAEAIRLGLTFNEYIKLIGGKVGLYHGIIGTFIPLLLVMVLTRFFGKKKSWVEGLKVWRFALLAGLGFTIPYVIAANFIGLEFPSLLGGLVCLSLTILATRHPWFRPREIWGFTENRSKTKKKQNPNPSKSEFPIWLAWMPYVLLTLFLVGSRLPGLPFAAWLKGYKIAINGIFGSEIDIISTPLYLPGTMLFLTSLITVGLHGMKWKGFLYAFKESASNLKEPIITLAFVVPLVRIFINSGQNPIGLPSMPLLLAQTASSMFGQVWPLIAPIIGSLGAFIAGSNTFSNMMFSLFQFGVAKRIGIDPSTVVALQAVGGAAGNMVSVHNVVAASAVVGLSGKEGIIMRRVLMPLTYYLLAAGILGLIIIRLF